MHARIKNLAAYAALFAMALWIAPSPAHAAGYGRLEGLVIGVDGRAAIDYQVHLIGPQGEALGRTTVQRDGLYSFNEVAPGRYSLGVEMPDGTLAPVAAPPVRLTSGELARRDLKLVQTDPQMTNSALQANYGVGAWWKNMSKPGKAWTVIAIVVAAALTYDALRKTDDEPTGSPN